MTKTCRVIAVILVFVLAGFFAQAQPGPGTTSGGGAVAGGPIGGGAPIGGGLCILVAMGIAYGVSRFYMERNIDSIDD
jgi:hypothetical protein